MTARSLELNVREIERILWLVSILSLVAGYYFVTEHFEGKIHASMERSIGLDERTTLNRRLVAESTRIRRVRDQLKRQLGGVLFGARPGDTTAALLGDLEALAHQNRARVLSILPQTPRLVPSPRIVSALDERHVLDSSALDISVRGRFSDLLALIATLPRGRVLIKIGEINFSVSSGQSGRTPKPLLDAKIHARVYHVTNSRLAGAL